MTTLPAEEAEFCRRHLTVCAGNGYHAFPMPPGTKRTYWKGWSRWCEIAPTLEQVDRWSDRHAHYGIALACGSSCIGIDIDEEDETRANLLHSLASAHLGDTPLVRFGRDPRRVLVYRVLGGSIASRTICPVELIGDGRYFVAHGIHPGTGRPYRWHDGGPEHHCLADLPVASLERLRDFFECVKTVYGIPAEEPAEPIAVERTVRSHVVAALRAPRSRPRSKAPRASEQWSLDDQLGVVDGREAYLAAKIYEAFCNGAVGANAIADVAWSEFKRTADLTRPKRDGSQPWSRGDAQRKAQALLRRASDRPTAGR
jgi:hypothetical protein